MDTLGKLFGSEARVRLMRLFLFNPDEAFGLSGMKLRAKVPQSAIRKEIGALLSAGFIKKKTATEQVKQKTKKVPGFILNSDFAHIYGLRGLLLNPLSLNRDKILKRFAPAGRIKFLALSRTFLLSGEGDTDIVIVGDGLKKKTIENILSSLESEIGKPLVYSAMDTKEFLYRISMYDRFVRNVIDGPRETLVNKLGV